jgi:centromere protein C
MEPLEYWRMERVVYGRPEGGQRTLVPHIQEVIRIPREPAPPLSKTHKRKRRTSTGTEGKPKSRSKSRSRVAEDDPEVVLVYNPEEGWDKDTECEKPVYDYEEGIYKRKRMFLLYLSARLLCQLLYHFMILIKIIFCCRCGNVGQ